MAVLIPNVLGDHAVDVEDFYRLTVDADTLDMGAVRFIRPYGVTALIAVARAYHAKHDQPLMLVNVPLRVHQYLERVDLFRLMGQYIQTDSTLTEYFDRTQSAPKLLELTRIRHTVDMLTVIAQVERIFAYWLQVSNLHSLIHVLSELCANIYQHSADDEGMVIVQTHEAVSKNAVRVRVAIGDAGVGVRANLRACCGDLGDEPLPYLQQALDGITSRHSGRGGLGLRTVQRVVQETGGYFWLRSETAAVLVNDDGQRQVWHGLPYVAGTQAAVELHAPLGQLS